MSQILFSSWKGKVVDNRGKKPEEYETPEGLPEEWLKDEKAKGFMDWDGFAIKDPDASILDLCVQFLDRVKGRSCAKCIPCRIGTRVMYDMMHDIAEGKGKKKDLEILKSLGGTLNEATKCKIGRTAPVPVLDALKYFREKVQQEIEEKKRKGGGKR